MSAGGTITINAQPFSNTGMVQSPAGSLSINYWDNTGQTLVLGTNAGSLKLTSGKIQGGTISLTNGVSLIVAASGVLDGVTVIRATAATVRSSLLARKP